MTKNDIFEHLRKTAAKNLDQDQDAVPASPPADSTKKRIGIEDLLNHNGKPTSSHSGNSSKD